MALRKNFRNFLIFFASAVTAVLFFLFIKKLFFSFSDNFPLFFDLFLLFVVFIFFPYVKGFYYRLGQSYWPRYFYGSRKIMAEMAEKFSSSMYPREVYGIISEIITDYFDPEKYAILTYKSKAGKYFVQYEKDFNFGAGREMSLSASFHQILGLSREPLILSKIKDGNREAGVSFFMQAGGEIAVPLNIKDKEVGAIILAKKANGENYDRKDLELLKIIGLQAAIVLENSLLYEEVRNFNSRLEEEVEKATADLRQANEQLKQLDTAKSEFISIASHQLRTPLTAIKGFISMILEGDFGKVATKIKKPLANVLKSSERLISLVDNLLDVSRIELGKIDYNFQEKKLEDVVADIVKELSLEAKAKKVDLSFVRPKNALPTVKMDEGKLREAIINLVDNAVKYTPAGGKVTVEALDRGRKLEISVSDTGIGIKDEDLPYLFHKFSRGQGTFVIDANGTGLGLYLARQIVEAHKGKIWAKSAGENKGSKFCFTLPLK